MKMMTAMYTLRRGGAYDRFIMMNEAFLERGWEVHCLSLTPIQIKHSFFYNHRMYFPFKKVDGMMAKLSVLIIFPLWAVWIGWRTRIDLIIAFGSLYAFLQGLSKYLLKKPMVTLIRGELAVGSLHLMKGIENIGLRFSDRIITNNIASRDEMLKSIGERKKIDVQVLYNNIPPMNISKLEDISKMREKYGIPQDVKILVTAGILNRGKNIDILIECMPKIDMKNLYLLIAGDGSMEVDIRHKEYLKGLAKRLGVDQRVIFTGWLEKEELWKIFQASDLFVLPSLNEGMPNAMLEALGCGLPCMGSNIPGIKDILYYDELLFDPTDEKYLADRIGIFFSDFHFLGRVKRLCYERKEIFDFDWKEYVFKKVQRHSVWGT